MNVMKTTLLFLFLLFVCLINAATYTSAVTGTFEFQKGDVLRFVSVYCRVRMVFNKYLILYFCFVMILEIVMEMLLFIRLMMATLSDFVFVVIFPGAFFVTRCCVDRCCTDVVHLVVQYGRPIHQHLYQQKQCKIDCIDVFFWRLTMHFSGFQAAKRRFARGAKQSRSKYLRIDNRRRYDWSDNKHLHDDGRAGRRSAHSQPVQHDNVLDWRRHGRLSDASTYTTAYARTTHTKPHAKSNSKTYTSSANTCGILIVFFFFVLKICLQFSICFSICSLRHHNLCSYCVFFF
jgi:hypothetical protein